MKLFYRRSKRRKNRRASKRIISLENKQLCTIPENTNHPLCIRLFYQNNNVSGNERGIYCNEHPRELQCIGNSLLSNDILCVVGMLLVMFVFFRRYR